MGDQPSVFSERLRAVRGARARTLADVAIACDCSAQAVHKWEAGEAYPSSKRLVALCRYLACSMDWIMEPDRLDFTAAPRKDE